MKMSLLHTNINWLNFLSNIFIYFIFLHKLIFDLSNNRSPVTHRMAPWVVKVFIRILPRILCMERPKKDEPHEDDSIPHEVLTDVFHVSSDGDKFTEYGSKRFSADYGMPGKFDDLFIIFIILFDVHYILLLFSKLSFEKKFEEDCLSNPYEHKFIWYCAWEWIYWKSPITDFLPEYKKCSSKYGSFLFVSFHCCCLCSSCRCCWIVYYLQ